MPQPHRAVLARADHPRPVRAERRGIDRTLSGSITRSSRSDRQASWSVERAKEVIGRRDCGVGGRTSRQRAIAVAQSPSLMQAAARSATALASRRRKSWYSSPERRTRAFAPRRAIPAPLPRALARARATSLRAAARRRLAAARHRRGPRDACLGCDPISEARPRLEQNLMRELDPLGRIVERRQQSGLDQAIAQRNQGRIVADVAGPAAALRDAAPTILDANEMAEKPRERLALLRRQRVFDLLRVVAKNGAEGRRTDDRRPRQPLTRTRSRRAARARRRAAAAHPAPAARPRPARR